MRNPFPKIGKIIKYEFKHSARTLLPLYGVLLVLGLLTGLSFDGKKAQQFIEDSIELGSNSIQINGVDASRGLLTGFLIFASSILTAVTIVITIVSFERRFKKSMIEEEAYLNLSLPCTMGEQLWGRFIMNFIWFIGCALVIFCSFLLCFIRMDLIGIFNSFKEGIPELQNGLAQYNMTLAKCFWIILLVTVSFCFWFITMIFAVNSVSILFPQNKGLFKFITLIVLFFLFSKTMNILPFADTEKVLRLTNDGNRVLVQNGLLVSGAALLWSAIQFAGTQLIFTKKLNLE